MATLRRAVERARQNGLIPPNGAISVVSLLRQFRPVPKGSVKALLSAMFTSTSKPMPWAVILCRFKGEAPNPEVENPIEKLYRGIFTPGTGGLVEFWRDASLGAIAITGSKVFGWLELDITRANAGIGSGATRSTFVDAAIRAATRTNPDALKGFFSQIAVLTHNWSKDGAPPGADWRTKVWSPFWIDGSADGRGKVTLTPPHNGNITAHEMGHGFGMQHDVSGFPNALCGSVLHHEPAALFLRSCLEGQFRPGGLRSAFDATELDVRAAGISRRRRLGLQGNHCDAGAGRRARIASQFSDEAPVSDWGDEMGLLHTVHKTDRLESGPWRTVYIYSPARARQRRRPYPGYSWIDFRSGYGWNARTVRRALRKHLVRGREA